MKYQFLDGERSGEVKQAEAVWMLIEGTSDNGNSNPNFWGVGKGNLWMAKSAFNAWWNTIVLQKYSHPSSTFGLHIYSDADLTATRNDNIGVVHQDYAGDLVDLSDWNATLGWCQLGVLGGALYSREMKRDKDKEKARNITIPLPRQRAVLHTVGDSYQRGDTNYIMVAQLTNYIAHRFQDWDKNLKERRACQVNAIEDYNDNWDVFAPIEQKARERALTGKKNGKSRKTTPLMVLTTKNDNPVDVFDLEHRRYKVADDKRIKRGIYPIMWDGTRKAVEDIQAVIDNGWRLAV